MSTLLDTDCPTIIPSLEGIPVEIRKLILADVSRRCIRVNKSIGKEAKSILLSPFKVSKLSSIGVALYNSLIGRVFFTTKSPRARVLVNLIGISLCGDVASLPEFLRSADTITNISDLDTIIIVSRLGESIHTRGMGFPLPTDLLTDCEFLKKVLRFEDMQNITSLAEPYVSLATAKHESFCRGFNYSSLNFLKLLKQSTSFHESLKNVKLLSRIDFECNKSVSKKLFLSFPIDQEIIAKLLEDKEYSFYKGNFISHFTDDSVLTYIHSIVPPGGDQHINVPLVLNAIPRFPDMDWSFAWNILDKCFCDSIKPLVRLLIPKCVPTSLSTLIETLGAGKIEELINVFLELRPDIIESQLEDLVLNKKSICRVLLVSKLAKPILAKMSLSRIFLMLSTVRKSSKNREMLISFIGEHMDIIPDNMIDIAVVSYPKLVTYLLNSFPTMKVSKSIVNVLHYTNKELASKIPESRIV